jgi:hypothetical protein
MFPPTHENAFPTKPTQFLYIWTRDKGSDSSAIVTLPRFENTNNYDSYYY